MQPFLRYSSRKLTIWNMWQMCILFPMLAFCMVGLLIMASSQIIVTYELIFFLSSGQEWGGSVFLGNVQQGN